MSARYGGCYAVTKGLLEEFGEDRIRDTPLSESAFVGAGIGAAMAGMRPIVEIMTVNFSLLALDQIVNNAATISAHVGRPVRGAAGDPHGDRRRPAARRAAFAQPGRLVRPHPRPARCWRRRRWRTRATCCAAALADPNPVLIFEHVMLYNLEGELDPAVTGVDIEHRARCAARRQRCDARHLWRHGLFKSLAAAEMLASEGIEAEVIDLRVLRPLDTPTILASVAQDAPRRDRRRGLEERLAVGRDRHAHRRRCVLRSRCAAAPGLRRAKCRCPMRRIWKTRRCRSRPTSPLRRAAW